MPNLIGTAPNQVPVNGMLGTAAFIEAASKQDTLLVVNVTTTTYTAYASAHYILTSSESTTLTLPVGVEGATVAVTTTGTATTNIIARNNTDKIMDLAENMTLDKAGATVTLRFLSNSWRII